MNPDLFRRGSTERGLQSFKRELNSFFDDFFSIRPVDFFENAWMPTIDMADEGNALRIKADLPGLAEKDIEVTVENNVLTISGEKKDENTTEDRESHLVISERSFGSFRRTIPLPQGVKADGIKAEFRNGVLEITVPRDSESKSRKIEVKNN